MKTTQAVRCGALAIATVALTGLSACSALKPTPVPPPAFFTLDGGSASALSALSTLSAASAASAALATSVTSGAPTLLVSAPQAGAGLDSPRIIYVRQAHQLEYFAHSEWVDTPARMLAPLIVAALGRAGAFRAVVATPTAAKADLRLDTEIVRLQHEFGAPPSHVRLTLRATLSDNTTRQVLAQMDLDHSADAASEDAYGGVVAANHATRVMLQTLVVFCSQAAQRWQAAESAAAKRAVGRL